MWERLYNAREKKYRAEDERVMNEWDERKMRVAGEEHIAQRSFPINNNRHIYIQIYFVRIYIWDPEWPSSNLMMMSQVAIHGRL
jgi:hypothetical protein